MGTFVLVPGASHTAWCWHKIVPLLEKAGYRVETIDLPGTPPNPSHQPRDLTLDIWADHVAEAVRKAEKPVILAGHSRGGFVISEAAEKAPDALAGLIYVTAIIPQPGQSLLEAAGFDPSIVPPIDENGCMEKFSDDVAKERFYHRCLPEVQAEACRHLYAEPMAPDRAPSGVTWERWGRVPRAYVECSDDIALDLATQQRKMQAAAPCDPVYTLDTDHSPFLCAPEALSVAMLEIARRFEAAGATA
jgi:pimeloyl-ACP methyl ester carboxylesterase